jgi:hypothetical protein
VYTRALKRRELEIRLAACGWRFLRRGGPATCGRMGNGRTRFRVHREINEQLARAILRRACEGKR